MQQLLTYTSPEGFSPGYKLIHQTTVPCGYRCSIEGRIRPHITHSQQRVHSPLCPPCSGHSALWNKLPPQGLHLCCSFCLECSSPRYPHGFAPCLLQTFLFKCQTLLAYLKENSNCSGFFFNTYLLIWLHGVLVVASHLHCIMQDLSSQHMDSAAAGLGLSSAAHGLSCPVTCEILDPWPRMEPEYPTLQGGFLTTGLLEKSLPSLLIPFPYFIFFHRSYHYLSLHTYLIVVSLIDCEPLEGRIPSVLFSVVTVLA